METSILMNMATWMKANGRQHQGKQERFTALIHTNIRDSLSLEVPKMPKRMQQSW